MAKILSLYFLIVYAAPLLLSTRIVYSFEVFQLAVVFVGYSLGALLGSLSTPSGSIARHESYAVASTVSIVLILVSYFIVRLPLLSDVVQKLLSGTYSSWALQNAINRYSGDVTSSFYDKIAVILFICYGFLVGTIRNNGYRLYWPLIVFGLMILIEMSGLARAGVLLAISAAASEHLIRNNYIYAKIKSSGLFLRAIGASAVLAAVFVFAAYMRVYSSSNPWETVAQKVPIYTIAMYEALLGWMHSVDNYQWSFGYNTFTAFYKILGSDVRQGFYDVTPTGYGATNVYTTLRGVFDDFGLPGAVIVYSGMGYLFMRYQKKALSPFSYLVLRLAVFFFIFVLYSPFIFSTCLAAFLLSYVILIRFSKKQARMNVNVLSV